jgi:hypothetical protein
MLEILKSKDFTTQEAEDFIEGVILLVNQRFDDKKELLATKEDLAGTKEALLNEINKVRTDLGGEINKVRADLGGEIGKVRVELSKEIVSETAKVRTDLGREINGVYRQLLLWIVGTGIGSVLLKTLIEYLLS